MILITLVDRMTDFMAIDWTIPLTRHFFCFCYEQSAPENNGHDKKSLLMLTPTYCNLYKLAMNEIGKHALP